MTRVRALLLAMAVTACLPLGGCLAAAAGGAVVGGAVGVTGMAIGGAAKGAGMVAGAVIPGDDD